MSMLEKLEDIKHVKLLTLNCNDGISLEVTNVTPQIAKDFVRYQSINRTGWVYAPKDRDKIVLATWFLNRGCTTSFSINKDVDLPWFKRLNIGRKIWRLNRQLTTK